MFFYRQCKQQQRDFGNQRCFNCNRIDFFYILITRELRINTEKKEIKKAIALQPPFLFSIVRSRIRLGLGFRSYQFISLSVNIDNLDRFIFFQVLTQFGDIYVHATRIEVVIVNPDSLQCKVTLQDFVGVCTKQAQQFGFLL